MGDLGSIPGLGRSPGEGKGYPLQYSGLENSMDSVDSDMTDVHFSHFENKILIACKINTEVMELLSCYTIVITNMESAKLILGAGKCIRTQGWISSPNQQKQRSRFFLIQGWYLLCLISAGCRTFW